MSNSNQRSPTLRSSLKRFLSGTPLGRWLLVPYRVFQASRISGRPLSHVLSWGLRSREITNLTYDLTERNRRYLACFVSAVTGASPEVVQDYLKELDADEALKSHIRQRTMRNPRRYVADPEPRFGRRSGWYAMVRTMKPRVIIETGVDKGLGTCVLAAALLRNTAEGHSGILLATDIDPEAGYLLGPPYDQAARILYGDSIESLKGLDGEIDLFINDSDHSAEYEAREYDTVASKLSEHAVIVGDNSHVTDVLHRFAMRTKRHFLFFKEEPYEHWYPGGGIGIAY